MALPKTHISLDVPKSLSRNLKVLSSAKGNEIMRNALKSSQGPPVKSMKGMVRRLKGQSRASTGATLRAINKKVSFPGKTTPGRGYMIAGIDFDYLETHQANTDDMYKRSGQKIRRKYMGITNVGRKAKGKGQRLKRRYVQSFQTTKLRRPAGSKKGTPQRNRPGKYWHILEGGWTNRRVKRKWSGYNFTQ